MTKFALFVFNGDPMCFIHVLLNALDMKERGSDARIILEGASTKLIPGLYEEGHPLNGLWKQCLEAGLVEGVCKACATKLGTVDAAQKKGLALLGEMAGHPSIAAWCADGWDVLTF